MSRKKGRKTTSRSNRKGNVVKASTRAKNKALTGKKTTGRAGKDGYAGYGGYARCHSEHPEIKLGNGVILGASCHYPREGYDVYVGFDYGMEFHHSKYPWHDTGDGVVEFLFKITDMSVPKDLVEFKNLLTYLEECLMAGKKVHIGCIGGHGRTGLVLSALVNQMLGEEDSTTWVRKKYCKKAVESTVQVEWLHKHFGIKKVDASKGYGSYWGGSSTSYRGSNYSGTKDAFGFAGGIDDLPGKKPADVKTGTSFHKSVPAKCAIW